MTSPRRDKDGNIIAPKRLAKAGKKRTPRGRAPAPMPQAPLVPGEMKGPIGKIRKLKPRKRVKEIGDEGVAVELFDKRKAVKKPRKATPKALARKTKAAGKLKGFENIAKRKEARAKAAGKTYDVAERAKSNPRLLKNLRAKNRAVDNAGLTNRAAKKVNKLEKQADGLAAIANRKSARTGRNTTAKSNPKLIKKLENKRKAVGRIKNRNR